MMLPLRTPDEVRLSMQLFAEATRDASKKERAAIRRSIIGCARRLGVCTRAFEEST